MDIQFYNRVTQKIEIEKVYGDKMVEWLYQSKPGHFFSTILCKAPLSKIYGVIQDSPLSTGKINSFIKNFDIDMDDYLPQENHSWEKPYSNFNQFFIRRFKADRRPFIQAPNQMAAFSEARYFGYTEVTNDELVPVKGQFLKPKELLANPKWESSFESGPMLLARLCPVDYHRFHFPDNGIILDDYRVDGLYHSVNPLALKSKQDILITNERHVTILETEHFGKLAYVEVGAICVGKIIQSHPLHQGASFERGDEKGYFLFGGSTVIVVGEKGKWKPSEDILSNTKKGLETYLHLGMTVANIG